MPIKNKDGSIYEVRKPNPLMKNQDSWSNFTVYNMKLGESIVEKLLKKFPSDGKIKLGTTETISKKNEKFETITLDLPAIPQPTEMPLPTLPPPEFPKVIKKINSDDVEAKNIQKPKFIHEKLKDFPVVVMNCLLAKIEEKFDLLYEDKGVKIRYSQEIAFEAVLLQETDYELNFWTHIETMARHSVVYPMNKTKRWWKIEEIKKAPQGFFCACKPSEIQPSFKTKF